MSTSSSDNSLFLYLLRLADDRLILGHRMSEWCGVGPILEEDIALANIALDQIGHAASLLEYAGQVEGQGRDQDRLAYFRDDIDYTCLQMVQLPRGDFGFTTARLFLFSLFSRLVYRHMAKHADDEQLRGLAGKHLKEIDYHVRHSREWMLRLGDGTEESHQRLQQAIDDLWMYTGEMFDMDEVDRTMVEAGNAPDLQKLRPEWRSQVEEVLDEATLTTPSDEQYMVSGGRRGFHTEHLGHLLAEMQRLPRAYPEAQW